jgi:hypothetical protein
MQFYELHEGDADLFFDVMLYREEEMDADEFFTIVQSIRRQVQDSYETESLIEAIAEELERNYGFVFISDDRLTAAVNVSKVEDDNFLADLDGEEGDEADEEVHVTGDADYRGVYADFDPQEPGLN